MPPAPTTDRHPQAAGHTPPPKPGSLNDVTAREAIWHRYEGDDWAAFDALPPRVRQRLHEHAYDPWAVNALIQFRTYRRKHASSQRAEITLLRYLDQCEALERAAFSDRYQDQVGTPLPHIAARATVQRYHGRSSGQPNGG